MHIRLVVEPQASEALKNVVRERLDIHIKYERGPARKGTQEVKFFSPGNPGSYQIFKVDSGIDTSTTTCHGSIISGVIHLVCSLPVLPDRTLTLTPDSGSVLKFMLLPDPESPEASPDATIRPVWYINPNQHYSQVNDHIVDLVYDITAGDVATFILVLVVGVLLLVAGAMAVQQ